jgi:hypothetical protein
MAPHLIPEQRGPENEWFIDSKEFTFWKKNPRWQIN